MKPFVLLVSVTLAACGGGGGGGGGDADGGGGDGIDAAAPAIDATPAWAIDSDGDGASDVVEDALGTDPDDEDDNPEANGDVAVLVPYQGGAPADQLLALQGGLEKVDLYLIVDRSGSMSAEMTALEDNMDTVIDALACSPAGSGEPPDCVPDLHAGLGTLGLQNKEPFTNRLDLQASPSFAALGLTTVTDTNTKEPETFATWAAVTGLGSASAGGCTLATVTARTTCPGGTWGYPCFRDDAFPVVVLATDEQPLADAADTYECPAWPGVVAPAMTARAARLVGLLGAGAVSGTSTDLAAMATDTGAVDAANGGEPLVFDGADTGAAAGVQAAMLTLVAGVPLDVGVALRDDEEDAVDAVEAFLDGFAAAPGGDAACEDAYEVDGERYLDAPPRTTLCWMMTAKANTTVEPTSEAQVFHATVDEIAEGVTVLQRRDVYFVVPPAP